jgi:hypothetical protein
VLVFSYTEVVHGKEWIMRFLPKGDPRLYLGPDVWRVMYRGYYIPEAQTGDYAMLRAAEVMKAAGYRYFVVENERSSATVMGSGYGYAYAGSGSAFAAAYSYPETGLLVRGLSEKPASGGQMVFDTAFVSAEIKRKYKIARRSAQGFISCAGVRGCCSTWVDQGGVCRAEARPS